MILKTIKISIFLAALAGIFWMYSYGRAVNQPADKNGAKAQFSVKPGDSVQDIASGLASQGLIDSPFFFKVYAWHKGLDKKMQAGVYDISASMPASEIAEVLSSGRTVSNERKIKIIEGWKNKDIAVYLEEEGLFSVEDFLQEAGSKDKYIERFSFLEEIPGPYDMEGYLFPDTYQIFKDASVEDVIGKMLNNFDKKVEQDIRQDIKEQGKSLYEIVTMASLIEKEVRSRRDMKMVSGIFWNRIKNGQPLQSCATLAYILGENKPIYSLKDTRTESPYNTYMNPGLPPGPIANPGLKAIEAAVYPADTDYNYFLTASETGETIFSKTLQEHNRNKAKYLK